MVFGSIHKKIKIQILFRSVVLGVASFLALL